MAKKSEIKSITTAISAVIAASTIAIPVGATENPFQMTDLSSGYMVADKEGKCGGMKMKEGKCGEKKSEN